MLIELKNTELGLNCLWIIECGLLQGPKFVSIIITCVCLDCVLCSGVDLCPTTTAYSAVEQEPGNLMPCILRENPGIVILEKSAYSNFASEPSVLLLWLVNAGSANRNVGKQGKFRPRIHCMDENQQKNRNHRGNVRPQVPQSQKPRLEIPKFARKDDGMDVMTKIHELKQYFKQNSMDLNRYCNKFQTSQSEIKDYCQSNNSPGDEGASYSMSSKVDAGSKLTRGSMTLQLDSKGERFAWFPKTLWIVNRKGVNCDDGRSVLTVDTMAFDLRGIDYDNPFVLTGCTMVIDTSICDLRDLTVAIMSVNDPEGFPWKVDDQGCVNFGGFLKATSCDGSRGCSVVSSNTQIAGEIRVISGILDSSATVQYWSKECRGSDHVHTEDTKSSSIGTSVLSVAARDGHKRYSLCAIKSDGCCCKDGCKAKYYMMAAGLLEGIQSTLFSKNGTGCPKVLNLRVEGKLVEGNLIRGFVGVAWCGGTPGKGVSSWLRQRWNRSSAVIIGVEEEEYTSLEYVGSSLVYMYMPVTKEGVKGEPQYAMTDFVSVMAKTRLRRVNSSGKLRRSQ
eukprot:Gb_33023 [translate_table: standard]